MANGPHNPEGEEDQRPDDNNPETTSAAATSKPVNFAPVPVTTLKAAVDGLSLNPVEHQRASKNKDQVGLKKPTPQPPHQPKPSVSLAAPTTLAGPTLLGSSRQVQSQPLTTPPIVHLPAVQSKPPPGAHTAIMRATPHIAAPINKAGSDAAFLRLNRSPDDYHTMTAQHNSHSPRPGKAPATTGSPQSHASYGTAGAGSGNNSNSSKGLFGSFKNKIFGSKKGNNAKGAQQPLQERGNAAVSSHHYNQQQPPQHGLFVSVSAVVDFKTLPENAVVRGMIQNKHTRTCLDIVTRDGRVGLWAQDLSRATQLWEYSKRDGTLRNVVTGRCLDALGFNGVRKVDGCPIGLWEANGRDWQRWSFASDGHLMNKGTSLAMDALGHQGQRDMNGCPVALWRKGKAPWQRWQFVQA